MHRNLVFLKSTLFEEYST